MVDMSNVELAFVEKTEPFLLLNHQFPSKLGGKPAWLSLSPIPLNESLECGKCRKALTFLLQVYCPITENTKSFHRTLFVFICRNVECYDRNSNKCFRVLRSQLSRENQFYSAEPPTATSSGPLADTHHALCVVCGLRGPKRCSRCQNVSYCCKEHQEVDWKNGHKHVCSKESETKAIKPNNTAYFPGINFPEFELVTEPEILNDETEEEKSEEDKLKEYADFMKSKDAEGMLPDSATKELEKMAVTEEIEDKVFSSFRERIKDEPDQVLRYQRKGQPLWVSDQHIPKEMDIPNCTCGAPRKFEFQIMPQLLSKMEVDSLGKSIDWGTLCVYTCANSCDIGNEYFEEFIWKQDFSDTSVPGIKKK